MAFNTPRLQQADLVLTCAEPQYRSSQEHTPRAITLSTMNGTTVTAASVDSSMVGCYLVPENGAPRGTIRQIRSVAGTTATVDTAFYASTGCTVMRVWDPADVPLVATGSGSTTTLVCSAHANVTNEPDNHWSATKSGYFALFKGGSNAGKASQIAGFTSASGTFTVSTAVTSTVAGELADLRKLVRSEAPPAISVDESAVATALVGEIDPGSPVVTTTKGSISFEMAVKGMQTTGSSAVAAAPPSDLADYLQDVFDETRNTGDTVATLGANTIAVSTGTRFSVGGFALAANGQAGQIRSISTNTLTFGASHIANSGIATGSTVYASAWYKRKQSDFRTRTFDCYRGGKFRQVLHGCTPTVSMSIERDAIARFAFAYTAGEALQYDCDRPVAQGATMPITLVDTTVPYDGKCARMLIDGVNVMVRSIAIDCGISPATRACLGGLCQTDGTFPTHGEVTVSLSVLADENDRTGFKDVVDRMRGGDVIDLLYQKGSAPGETFCWSVPAAQLNKSTFEYSDSLGEFSCTFTAVKPQATRANTFAATLPAFAFGWL